MFWNRGKKNDWACLKCGKLNHPDGEFCEFCGHSKHQAVVPDKAPISIQKSKMGIIRCLICGTECEISALFCCNCGASLKKTTPPSIPVQEIAPEPQRKEVLVRCVHCGTMNRAHDHFCSHCSEEIRVEKTNVSAQEEPRQKTASFCPECGARCTNETAFCNECGARIAIGR